MIEFSEVFSLLKSNPLLTAGMGTVAFGSVMYLVKGIPRWIYGTVKRLCTIELKINSDATYFSEVIYEVTKHRVGIFSRFYALAGKNLVTGYGSSIGWFEGRPFVFTRNLMEGKIHIHETLHIVMYTRDKSRLENLIKQATRHQDDGNILVSSVSTGRTSYCFRKKRRDVSSVFANNGRVDSIIKKIEWFRKNEAWYMERGIPYKLVIMLYGEPGTGKSSLVFAISSHFKNNLNVITNLLDIDKSVSNLYGDFGLIEDIDMLVNSRENDHKDEPSVNVIPSDNPTSIDGLSISTKGNTLHDLINSLDGVMTPHGMVLFITTNYIDKLDPALVRDGRIDVRTEIGPLETEAICRMYKSFYGVELKVPYIPARTGASLQKIFMNNDADQAIKELLP